jgi:group I intron endonuclease
MEPLGCIYLIECLVVVDGWVKRYVGQSVHEDETIRFNDHWRQRKRNRCLLHNAMIAHGRKNFKVTRLCTVPHSALDRMEEYYADVYGVYMWDSPGGYNMVWAGSGGRLGIPHTPETIEKMKNRPVTEDTKQRMREGADSRWTPEYRAKWGEIMANRDPTKVTTDETRTKVSNALRQRAANMTPEQKQAQYSKISGENCKTAKLTQELVDDIRAAYADGKLQKDLVVSFGVSKTTISRICRGETWKV